MYNKAKQVYMKVSILTVFSELYKPFVSTSIIKRAQDNGLVSIDIDEFFSFVEPKERIDAPTFGHGPGMLIKPVVVQKAIESKERQAGHAFKIFFSPQGTKLDQALVASIAQKAQKAGHLMLVAGRYEGMDARVEQEYADVTISVGDFVLMGGDLAALTVLESVLRFVPGVVGKTESVEDESFSGAFVEYPHYTEPVVWKGYEVPEVIRSGNHAAMKKWRMNEAARKTVYNHFDWLRTRSLTHDELQLAHKHIPHHYTALLHTDVLISDDKKKGTTSVTSLDIHDIARSSKTYGIKGYFIVTPLHDQQKIVQRLLDFWMSDGMEYNASRHEAVKQVSVASSLDEVVAAIEAIEGKKPIVIATSAREIDHSQTISFYDQEKVWALERPVLLIFGTGRGLAPERLEAADFLLKPVKAFTDYNHLSVRSAVAIVLDRWLGINEVSVPK
jgi:tRNA (guanine37-N1)-methyltransferase